MRVVIVAAVLTAGCFALEGSSGSGSDAPSGTIDAPPGPDSPAGPDAPSYGSCLETLLAGASTGDGTYTIDPVDGPPLLVYCDMTGDGGGWTIWIPDGLVAYWSFEGTDPASATIGVYPGGLEGDAGISTIVLASAFGASVSFGSDETSRLTMSAGVPLAAASTVTFWSHHADCSNNEIPLHFADGSWMGDLYYERGRVSLAGLPMVMDTTASSNCSSTVGTWIHHAYVDDGASLRYYRDGVEKIPEVLAYATLAGRVLSRFGAQPGFTTNGMAGQLDDVAVFSRALTLAEIELVVAQARAGRPLRWR